MAVADLLRWCLGWFMSDGKLLGMIERLSQSG